MDPFSLNLIMIIGFVLGSGLIILEAFIPGFGVAGCCGVILEIAALRCCWLSYGRVPTLLALAGVLLLIGCAVFFSYRSAKSGRLSRSNLVLNATETAESAAADNAQWIGREGIVVTALRPAGFVEVDGTRLNARSVGDFIKKGTPVEITGIEGDHFIIRQKA